MKKLILITALMVAATAYSQHDHSHHHHDTSAKVKPKDPPMSHAFSLNLPMNRNGSGTGWLPDSTPMYGYMIHGKRWMYMLHSNVFLRYTATDVFSAGTMGDRKADAVTWFMGMGQRRVGEKGLFRFSGMISFDPLFGGNGYPLLFQTGETWRGQALVNRQHPHDFFSELSLGYTHAFNKNTDVFVYAGYPGEPALGSVAFMHRVSSLYGPDAPLSHHWNDGTHITFGVLTVGIRYGKFKLDISNFTGREPDENRYHFDRPRFDSYSARVSFNLNPFWSFQASQSFVKSPESLRPQENVQRSTVSAICSKPLSRYHFLNVTALWGLNNSHSAEHAALLEAAFVAGRWAFYGRYEFVQKSVHELALNEEAFKHDAIFNVNALSLGGSYALVRNKSYVMALGAQASIYGADKRLNITYGKSPASAQVFLRIYPPRMFRN